MRKKITAEEKRVREWIIKWLRDRNDLDFVILPIDDRPDFLIEFNENKKKIGFAITQIVNQNLFKITNPPKRDVQLDKVYRCSFPLEPQNWIQKLFPKKNGKAKSYKKENNLDEINLVIFCDLVPDDKEEIRLFINQELCDYFFSLVADQESINFDQIFYVNFEGKFMQVYKNGKISIPVKRVIYEKTPCITVETQFCVIGKKPKNIDLSKNDIERDVSL